MRTLAVWLMLVSIGAADVWVITPSGYYIMRFDSAGVPTVVPAPGITGYHIEGNPPDKPDPPTPPTDDKWGLAKTSENAARAVNDPETAAKISPTYEQMGKLVQDGSIKQDQLKVALTLAYNAAVGSQKAAWATWKSTTDAAYNTVNFGSAKDAGQGLIDIGVGVGKTSQSANGDFLRFLIEVLIPLILQILELLNPDNADLSSASPLDSLVTFEDAVANTVVIEGAP